MWVVWLVRGCSRDQFVKTPLYVQISGTWDGTKIDIAAGDYGGELDPHGATGEFNPSSHPFFAFELRGR
jgi:hypothetical protein